MIAPRKEVMMEVLLGIIIVIVVALAVLVCSVIYLIFKSIQFTVQATNLYKKMIERQDRMISLLSDLRDGSKKVAASDSERAQTVSNPSPGKSKQEPRDSSKKVVASDSKTAQATPAPSPGELKLKPEEKWVCQNCGTENNRYRPACYKCKTPIP